MRRAPVALGALVLSVAPAVLVSGAAYAQTTPPTTVEVKTSTVEQEVTVTTLERSEVTQPEVNGVNNNDDSDKTGLWGLAGLLGLLGLAGLAGRKKRQDRGGDVEVTTRPPPIGKTAPPTASGATSATDHPTTNRP